MVGPYPKIFALGHRNIRDIFDDPVEITEKFDGSQIGFGRIKGDLFVRSRGTQIFPESSDKLFKPAVEHILSIEDRLVEGVFYYGETLYRPKHNVLAYERVPRNHIALFAIRYEDGSFCNDWALLKTVADDFEIDVVPLIYQGKFEANDISGLLNRASLLGNTLIEGVVVKNYSRDYMLGGAHIPLMAGKFVSEKFKEKHNSARPKFTGKGKWELYCEGYRTEARWKKAVQHLREAGNLLGDPKDIGSLIKEVQQDIVVEHLDEIKEYLWNNFKGDLLRKAIAGLPEWYKNELLTGSIDVE